MCWLPLILYMYIALYIFRYTAMCRQSMSLLTLNQIVKSRLEVRAFLLVLLWSSIVLTLLAAWTALSALWTLWAWATLACWTLLIVSWLLYEHSARELELACLGVDVDELDVDGVALLDACLFYCLKTLPVYLGDVEQSVLAWEELYEASVWHD